MLGTASPARPPGFLDPGGAQNSRPGGGPPLPSAARLRNRVGPGHVCVARIGSRRRGRTTGCCLAWTLRALGTLFPATVGEGRSLPSEACLFAAPLLHSQHSSLLVLVFNPVPAPSPPCPRRRDWPPPPSAGTFGRPDPPAGGRECPRADSVRLWWGDPEMLVHACPPHPSPEQGSP